MKTSTKIAIGVTIIVLALLVIILLTRGQSDSNFESNPNEITDNGQVLVPSDNQIGETNPTETAVNQELIKIYSELFSKSWLQRHHLNMYEPVTLRAQGTPDFIDYFDNNIESLRPGDGISTRFEPQTSSDQIRPQESGVVYSDIMGTLITTQNNSNTRQSVRVTIEFVPVDFDYQINSINVETL